MSEFRKTVVKAWRKAVRSLLWGLLWPARALFRRFVPIDRSMIAFMTLRGNYGCNPKYIYEELKRRKASYRLVWLSAADVRKGGYPKGCRCVSVRSLRGIYYASRARLWIDNGVIFSTLFEKRPGQLHAQTMHGSLGIKKLDNAVKAKRREGRHGETVIRRESQKTDVLFSNSEFEENVFRGVFWKNTPMLRLGHARTDILFDRDAGRIAEIRRRLRKRYGVPIEAKILLFAPTYRRGVFPEEEICMDFRRLCDELDARFGGKFALLVRFHKMTHGVRLGKEARKAVFNVTDYPDMQELMQVTDVGITDYSSWIFDYVLTRRPGFLFAPDADAYETSTGLCYPLAAAPFPVARNVDELLSAIRSFDAEGFEERVEAFLRGKQCTDDGHASERIADWIAGAMDGERGGSDHV